MDTDSGLASGCEVQKAPAIVTNTLRKAEIAVTEICCDDPLPGMTSSVQREDAYLVALTLSDFAHRVYWEEGRANAGVRPAGRRYVYP